MRHTYPNLSRKGLLTALVSCLLSGQAVADVAGRVNFITGKVQAVAADGTRRNLVKGELVNSGERLETNSGRVQIRFTDGSFISLQPNTVFGLDSYAFNKATPNEGSLLFNFIKGSMRTVSGAIGKVNRNNYAVKTPVATIGIRGTSYAATQEPNGRLLLSVGSGMVNLANDFGASNVNAGQTFQVETGQAPTNAPKGDSVTARANTPESQQEKEEETTSQDDSKKPDLAVGDQTSKDGSLLVEAAIQTNNGIPRVSSFGSLLKGESGVQIYPNVQGFYSEVSIDGKANGRLLSITGTDFTGGNTAGKVIVNTRNGFKSLNFSNVEQVGSLFLGAWTNGTASVVDPYLGTVQQLNLSAIQFMPYVVGTTAEKNLGNNMTASYSRAGSLAKGTGTLTELNIIIDLNLMPLVTVDMAASLANINYTAQLTKAPLLDISFDKKFSGFILSGDGNGLYAKSSNASLCANEQCPVTLSAFLSGSDMGVVYEIFRNQTAIISGVAALSGNETAINSEIDPKSLPSDLEGKYSAAFKSTNNNINIADSNNLAAVFDSRSNGLMSAFHVATVNGEKVAQDFYGALNAADTLAAETKDIGHAANSLAWGRWTNGRVDIGNDANGGVAISANDNIHYMIGLPTPSNQLPTSGAVRYNLVGGTSTATFGTLGTNQQTVSAHDIGQVSRGNLTVDFNRATTQLSLGITGFSKASTLQSLDISGSGSLTSASNALSFSGMNVLANQGALSCNGCSATANGQFFGAVSPISQSVQTAPVAAGLLYDISGTVQATQATSIQVQGAAGFANPSVVTLNP
jgi:hypothetical protein